MFFLGGRAREHTADPVLRHLADGSLDLPVRLRVPLACAPAAGNVNADLVEQPVSESPAVEHPDGQVPLAPGAAAGLPAEHLARADDRWMVIPLPALPGGGCALLAPRAEHIRPADAGPANHPDDLRLVGTLLDQRLLQGFDVIHIVHRLRSLRLSMRSISAIEPKTSTLKRRIATAIQAKTSIFPSRH